MHSFALKLLVALHTGGHQQKTGPQKSGVFVPGSLPARLQDVGLCPYQGHSFHRGTTPRSIAASFSDPVCGDWFPAAAVTKWQKEWLKTTETYSPTCPWKVRNPGVSKDFLLVGISEKESVTCISQVLVRPAILGVPWFVDSPRQFLPLSSHVLSVGFCLCPFSSYKDVSHTD